MAVIVLQDGCFVQREVRLRQIIAHLQFMIQYKVEDTIRAPSTKSCSLHLPLWHVPRRVYNRLDNAIMGSDPEQQMYVGTSS